MRLLSEWKIYKALSHTQRGSFRQFLCVYIGTQVFLLAVFMFCLYYNVFGNLGTAGVTAAFLGVIGVNATGFSAIRCIGKLSVTGKSENT